MTTFIPVFAEDELPNNKGRAVTVEGTSVLVCRASNEWYAVLNRCSHQESELEGGRIRGCYVSCPLHGVRFDLRNGEPMGSLTRVAIPTYPVRVTDGMVEVGVEPVD